MKALILAAGFGTRLLPYTETTPKPLFTIDGQPVLDITICSLIDAGCQQIAINTHHLHDKITDFVNSRSYPIPITVRYEPEILGTGGGIKNMADIWSEQPFMVINSDVVSNIDPGSVYRYHLAHPYPVTLVLHDVDRFNTVTVSRDEFVLAFLNPTELSKNRPQNTLAFTGIQVLDPLVLDYIPDSGFYSSISAFRRMISDGKKIKALTIEGHYWQDIGTPASYKQAAYDEMAPSAFQRAYPDSQAGPIERSELSGDGSDRRWYRLSDGSRSLVMADHGIRGSEATQEVDAFVAIGKHLKSSGVPVPEIFSYDTFSGLVFMEDAGDQSLQETVLKTEGSEAAIIELYRPVIRQLVNMSISGATEFQTDWTWQTAVYDRELILEKECRYFIDAFLQNYLGQPVGFDALAEDFDRLASQVGKNSTTGFMHRDMQSRNVMIKDGDIFFIDFQGGRIGPLEYDLASLLIDPYVNLPETARSLLLDDCVQHLSYQRDIDPDRFRTGFRYCCLTRNLQILGAFGFLSRVKGKTYFEAYIPAAVKTLMNNLSDERGDEFPELKKIVDSIQIM
jgi:aminoglycoside/choline kinase family phosphotransferase/GTP:adenosylcobinamide-phosphate guanylyltransferase